MRSRVSFLTLIYALYLSAHSACLWLATATVQNLPCPLRNESFRSNFRALNQSGCRIAFPSCEGVSQCLSQGGKGARVQTLLSQWIRSVWSAQTLPAICGGSVLSTQDAHIYTANSHPNYLGIQISNAENLPPSARSPTGNLCEDLSVEFDTLNNHLFNKHTLQHRTVGDETDTFSVFNAPT